MAEPKTIQWEKDGYLGILSIDNPPENYFINPEFVSIPQLKEWLSDDIKAMIITGTGRHFSAGADMKALINQSVNLSVLKQNMIKGNQLLDFIAGLEIPILASISGVCFGGGLEVALACDIRICTSRSMFAFPEINHDLIPGLGGVKRLQKICGHKIAMEIMFSGDILNAGKALELKIADQVIPSKDCLGYGKQFLHGLVKDRPMKLIQLLMRSFRNAESLDADGAMIKDVEMFCELAHDYSVKKMKGK
jgi:enoyl-CoA hydratase/carnithine racemase